jgi:hypothetical protein
MKKLYFLNEEESKRILNLHKDATKKQYLKEDDGQLYKQFAIDGSGNINIVDASGKTKRMYNPSTDENLPTYGETATNVFTPGRSTEINPTVTDATVTNKTKVQSKTNPLVTKIQQSLKEKGVNLGTSGPNKDGIDGILGKLTLNGIVSALGGGTTVEKTTKTEIEPETMARKEVSLKQEPNPELELKQTTPSTPTPAADIKVATETQPGKTPVASTPVKDDEVATDDGRPDDEKING